MKICTSNGYESNDFKKVQHNFISIKILTFVFGVWLIVLYGKEWFLAAKWLQIKLSLVIGLYAYHFYLLVLVRKFAKDENTHSSRFYRFLNEAPVLIVLTIIVLAIVKYF